MRASRSLYRRIGHRLARRRCPITTSGADRSGPRHRLTNGRDDFGGEPAEDVQAVRALYDQEYTRFYDRPVPGSDVEVLSFAVTVATAVEPVEPAAAVPFAAWRAGRVRGELPCLIICGANTDWSPEN